MVSAAELRTAWAAGRTTSGTRPVLPIAFAVELVAGPGLDQGQGAVPRAWEAQTRCRS
jgi:hypothetical protein